MVDATSLEPALLRFKHAEKRMHELNSVISDFYATRPYDVTRDFDAHRRKYIWKLRVVREVPSEISLIMSDCLHNLRSTLDNLIWQIASDRGARREVLDASSYPICAHRNDYRRWDEAGILREDCGLARIAGLDPTVQAIVETTQPFQSERPEEHPLRWLSLLSNRDKHRRLHVAQAAAVGSEIVLKTELGDMPIGVRDDAGRLRSPVQLTPGPLQEGAVVAQLTLPPVDFEVPVDLSLVLDLVFADGPLVGRPLFASLCLILDFIDDHVLTEVGRHAS